MIPTIVQLVVLIGLIGTIRMNITSGTYNLGFLGMDLGAVPVDSKGVYFLFPILAGFASWFLCVSQNRINVLQAEQSKGMQYGTLAFSVGLSLWLGFYVPAGVAVYWIASNLLSIVQQILLNRIYNPEKYVDYEELAKTQKELEELGGIGLTKRTIEEKKREREDYKRFLGIENKHLVFYSESNGFYKYFKGIIEYILENTNIFVHYITSDPQDHIFELEKERSNLKAYYIGEKKLITLMMKMDADIVCMTMPDLESFHIKRSYIRSDVEYVYIQHHMGSENMVLRKGAVDHFDTVFVAGRHQKEEIEAGERYYKLPHKNLVEQGYPLLDEMIVEYSAYAPKPEGVKKMILIAPSWHREGIMYTCVKELIDELLLTRCHIILRAHPQYVRHNRESLELLARSYEGNRDVEIQVDFSSNNPVLEADLIITDWSGIAYEYAFATLRPVLYVDTPMKVKNPEYKYIGVEPIDIWIRNRIGVSVRPEELAGISRITEELFNRRDDYQRTIRELRDNYIYNIGGSAKYGADYIISAIKTKIEERKSRSIRDN